MSTNQQAAAFGAGRFATSYRPKVNAMEIERLHKLGRGAQTIATITGYSMEDVRLVLNPPMVKAPQPANDAAPVWPLGECDDLARTVIQMVAQQRGIEVADVVGQTHLQKINAARNAMYAALDEFHPGLSRLDMSGIFGRDQAAISAGIAQHKRTAFGS